MKSKNERDAWREKFTLCVFIVMACFILAFLTYGMNIFVCKGNKNLEYGRLSKNKPKFPFIIAKGFLYEVDPGHKYFEDLKELGMKNATALMRMNLPVCKARFNGSVMGSGMPGMDFILRDDKNLSQTGAVHYSWADVTRLNYIVIDGDVYDPSENQEEFFEEFISRYRGRDGTEGVADFDEDALDCFKSAFKAGKLLQKSYGCIFADLILYISTVAIFGLIIVRFLLATIYYWRIRFKMSAITRTPPKNPMPVITLVTCYSEDRKGIQGTLNSLCLQNYDEENRIAIVVADGQVKGSGSNMTTPEILLDLIECVTEDFPDPKDYISLASGAKRHNRAAVVPGVYEYRGRRISVILVIKTGSEEEENSNSKPGNRGKRDSQVIIMGFFQRLIFNDLLIPLDYEIYKSLVLLKPHIEPHVYEAILMIDADTIVDPAAITQMTALLRADKMVIGMCGETKISNKFGSWVTTIQVFEYYISHHLNKSFESIFGGVTCIPGCFGMYRLQDLKVINGENFSLPLLAHPFILNSYSSIETKTLHQKNLLLLGEDRYLTTLLLKNFFSRKLIFCPTATCQTEVPSAFSVLLSQRRRWINSTIHNYFELAMVDQLCGTFCCSMKFVVLMELMGTLVLPAAIFFTGVLIIAAFLVEPAWIPIIMLFGILGLPAILIGLTTFDITQVFWLAIYIFSLPIWNFVLPTYAFWHFDDFTWGETRKIAGLQDKGHEDSAGAYDLKKCKVALLEDLILAEPIAYDIKIMSSQKSENTIVDRKRNKKATNR